MHSAVREIGVHLSPPRQMSQDEAIEYLADDDELLEVTPARYRIRKRILDTRERGKQAIRSKESFQERSQEI